MKTTHPTSSTSAVDRKQIRDLLQMNIDSRDGFAYAGKRLAEKHSSLSMRFHHYSNQRNDFFEKLKEIGGMSLDESAERGTIAASLHRTWMELRDELNESVDVSAVVVEAQLGESYIKQAYEIAIDAFIEPRLRALLTQQYESVKESSSWLVGLREEDQRREATAGDMYSQKSNAPTGSEQQKKTH